MRIRPRPFKWRGQSFPDARKIAKSGLFDPGYYGERSGLRFSTTQGAIGHFLKATDGNDPHPLFSMSWYRETYPDVADVGENPFLHFLRHGASEGRNPSIYFDTRFYLDTYPDVAASKVNALAHYLEHGAAEGRNPSSWFNTSDYLAVHVDVAAAGINALVHYARYGKTEGRRLSGRPYLLDERYGLSEVMFGQWRPQVIERYRRAHPPSSLRELIVVQSDAAEGDQERWADVREGAGKLGLDLTWGRVGDVQRLIEQATPSSLVLFTQGGDRLDDAGLQTLLTRCPEEADLVVFDMFYRHDGSVFPVLQPGANPQHVRSVDSVFSRFAVRGSLAKRIVGWGERDARRLLLAALDLVEAESRFGGFHHVNAPILETPALDSAIEERRWRAVLADEVETDVGRKPRSEKVSVIICTKDNGVLLDQLLEHLTTSCSAVHEIFVVSNQTSNLLAKRTLERWAADRRVTIIQYPEAFNFSDQCNRAAAEASGDMLLFLNDDIIGLNDVWLDRLIDALADPGIGIVGPRLLYPNESIQHAGMYLGFRGTAGHVMRHARLPNADYLFMATSARDVSCVSGAVLLMRRSTFEDLGGFDIQLRTIYQDVDLCLRVRGLGQRVLYVPGATLLHLESVTLKTQLSSSKMPRQRRAEQAYFLRLYEDGRLRNDRFHNSAYELDDESLRTLAKA